MLLLFVVVFFLLLLYFVDFLVVFLVIRPYQFNSLLHGLFFGNWKNKRKMGGVLTCGRGLTWFHLGAFPPCSLSLDSFFLHPTWAMSTRAWVSVAVKRGPTTIHLRKIVKMGWENKFAELLVAVAFHPMINSWTQSMKWTSLHPYRWAVFVFTSKRL